MPDHRCQGEQLLALRVETCHPIIDDLTQQGRDGGLCHVSQRPVFPFPPENAGLFEGAQQFAEEEGIPLGTALNIRHQPTRIGLVERITGGNEMMHRGVVQWVQIEASGMCLTDENRKELGQRMTAGEFVRTIGDEHK
jgi:hypothetical protein